ncbi:hypothetical protein ACE7GA_26305 [Roseomonas sp. CCTCC AB2023176]|uniref:hypothetical protein n=1 Tax=Roseomonas sp. CCTCC AB2023176 TaxID=3342640 RepID=UPI0035E00336
MSELEVLEAGMRDGVPAIRLRLAFGPGGAGDFVSLSLGPYALSVQGDIRVLRARVSVADATNLANAFIVVREWEAQGAYVRQANYPVRLPAENAVCVAGLEVREPNRVLQPVLALQKRDNTAAGSVVIDISGLAFAPLHELLA